MSLYEFGSDASGLRFQIEALDDGEGGTNFTVHVFTGSLNLNALYWGDGDETGGESSSNFTGAKSEKALNMNGSGETWDGAYKLSEAGLGHGDGSTYLTAGGEDYNFTVDNLDLSQFSTRPLAVQPPGWPGPLSVNSLSTAASGG